MSFHVSFVINASVILATPYSISSRLPFLIFDEIFSFSNPKKIHGLHLASFGNGFPFFFLLFFLFFYELCLVFSCFLLGFSSIAAATNSYTSSLPSPPPMLPAMTKAEPSMVVKPFKIATYMPKTMFVDHFGLIPFNHRLWPDHHTPLQPLSSHGAPTGRAHFHGRAL